MQSYLFTPGPLTTTETVRNAQLRDWGSRDTEFIALTKRVRERLAFIANAGDSHVPVLLQGPGTYAMEATIATLVAPADRLLVLVNGAYGHRIAEIARRLKLNVDVLEQDELHPIEPETVATYLEDKGPFDFMAVVHLETTTGLLNPIHELSDLAARFDAGLIVDAMSSFGATPIDLQSLKCSALVASSNKCLHGVPGLSFVICDRKALYRTGHSTPSLSLDLKHQVDGFEGSGEWRFTPPTHCLAAFDCALDEFLADGGVAARQARYAGNAELVRARLKSLGFKPVLTENCRSDVILTFAYPDGGWFDFDRLYDTLASQSYYIYRGKLTQTETFRIGCIGALHSENFKEMLDLFAATVEKMRANPRTVEPTS